MVTWYYSGYIIGKNDLCMLRKNKYEKVQIKIFDSDGCEITISRIFDDDSTKAKLIFNKFDISTLNNKVLRIGFIDDGELYSFGFADENGGIWWRKSRGCEIR